MPQFFERDTPTYQAPGTETPYLKAQQEWDNRLGSAYSQTQLWKQLAWILLLVVVLALAAVIVLLSRRQETVYVAEVGQGGRVINVAPLSVSYRPNQVQTEYFLGQFVQLIRGLPLDPVVAKQNWIKAYAYLTSRGANQLNSLMQQNNPLSLLGKQTVTINIDAINPLSPTSYNLLWTETSYDSQGQIVSTKHWSGVFTVTIIPPKTQQQIFINPLGIMIDNLNWSQNN